MAHDGAHRSRGLSSVLTCASLVGVIAGCVTVGCVTVGRENFGDPMTLDLAIVGEGLDEPAIYAGLRAKGYTINEVTNAYLALVNRGAWEVLDEDAAPSWPPNAREAWRTGSARCRALAKDGDWQHDDDVQSCGRALGTDVMHKIGEGNRAWRLVVVRREYGELSIGAQPPGADFFSQAHRGPVDDVDGIVAGIIDVLKDENIRHHNRTFTEPSHAP